MSGGSYNYAYRHLEQFGDSLQTEASGCGYADRTLRELFKLHCYKVAEAMRAIEWNDSGDGAAKEQELIKACIAPEALPAQMRSALLRDIEEVEEAMKTARAILEGGA